MGVSVQSLNLLWHWYVGKRNSSDKVVTAYLKESRKGRFIVTTLNSWILKEGKRNAFYMLSPLSKNLIFYIKPCYCNPPFRHVYEKLSRLCDCSNNLQNRQSVFSLAAKEYWLSGAKIVQLSNWKPEAPNPLKACIPFKMNIISCLIVYHFNRNITVNPTKCQNHEAFPNGTISDSSFHSGSCFKMVLHC